MYCRSIQGVERFNLEEVHPHLSEGRVKNISGETILSAANLLVFASPVLHKSGVLDHAATKTGFLVKFNPTTCPHNNLRDVAYFVSASIACTDEYVDKGVGLISGFLMMGRSRLNPQPRVMKKNVC
uniref:Uncharacterized protein n=1 Tax=Timema cristinae TaxID=61476 RepID=A0A7R9CQI4_TIMCR|nr:unnamed protein product [Timema cristinae]